MNSMKKLSLLTLLTLLIGQVGAAAFTPYQVENTAKVLVYWGDTADNITTNNNPEDFSGSIEGKDGRVLALRTIAFENNDELTHKDSRATGKVEFDSEINTGVDGLLLLVNENETELTIDTQALGSQIILMSDLRSNSISRTSGGDFALTVEYLGDDSLSTPDNPSTAGRFDDTPTGEWFFKYVQRIKDRQVENQPIFEGYKTTTGQLTGRFGPGDNITVGEMLKVVLRVSGLDEQNSNLDASLTNSTHWSVGFQNRAINEGLTIMEAVGINPDRPVSRGEFFQALSEAQNLLTATNFNSYSCNTTDLTFEDLDNSNPYTQYACILVKDGVISGTDAGFLNLFDNINRAEVAKILNTALDIYVEQPTAINDAIDAVIDLNDQQTNNGGSGGSGNSNNPNVSEAIVENSLPSQPDRYYEVKSTNSLTIDSIDNSLITMTWPISPGSQEVAIATGNTLLDSITVNNGNVLRIKATNIDWENVDYTLEFKEGALTYSDGTVNAETTLVFNPNFPTSGQALTWETQEVDYNNNLMAVRLAVEDTAGNVDLSNNPEQAFDIIRTPFGVPFRSIAVAKVFGDDNDIVVFLDTDPTFTEAEAGGEYEINVDGLKYESGLDVPAFNSTFTINSKFLSEGTAFATTLSTDSTPFRIVFPNEGSAIRLNDLNFTLERVEQVQGGNPNFDDQTNQLGTPVIDSSGRLSILKQFQWSDGDYILTIEDTRFNESESFSFKVDTQ